MKQAYDDWINVVEYDGKALLRFKQKKKSVTTRSETAKASATVSYPVSNGLVHSQKQLAGPANAEQSSLRNISEGTYYLSLTFISSMFPVHSLCILTVLLEHLYIFICKKELPLSSMQFFTVLYLLSYTVYRTYS